MEPSSTTALRSRRAVLVGATAAVAAHLLALYGPAVGIEGPVSWTDKVVHVLLFAAPTYAVGLALRAIVPAALIFAAHAPVSEAVQHALLPNRSGDPWDAVFDLVGVGLAAGVLVVRRRAQR
jgi:hypothetical protein